MVERPLVSRFHPLFLGGVLLFFFSAVVLAEPGYLLVLRDSSGAEAVRKVRALERQGGFFLVQSFAGKSEQIDGLNVATTVDLAALELPNLKISTDIEAAKALELRTRASLKKYPKLAPLLATALPQMRGDIERAERGERKVAGVWQTAESTAVHEPKRTIKRGTLVLKNGTSYSDVDIVSATPQELSIVHSSGIAKIPLSLVPEQFIKENLPAAPAADAKPKK